MRKDKKDCKTLGLKEKFANWIDGYLFYPSTFQKLVSLLLIPLSLVYCLITLSKRVFAKKYIPPLPVISIGNLTVGGSGKTPLTIELAKRYEKSCILLRGYGRKSKGLIVVSLFGEILVDVYKSGDEAMMIAKSLPKSSVIVSEDRVAGIKKAKELGCSVLFLDDGFRHAIKKLDILIEPKDGLFLFCLPSGPFREPPFLARFADIRLKEGIDFKRKVNIINPKPKMALFTAISNPKRLDEYLPKEVIAKRYLLDHAYFKKDEIEQFLKESNADSILCTKKDSVKLDEFKVPLSILELEIELNGEIFDKVDRYIRLHG